MSAKKCGAKLMSLIYILKNARYHRYTVFPPKIFFVLLGKKKVNVASSTNFFLSKKKCYGKSYILLSLTYLPKLNNRYIELYP